MDNKEFVSKIHELRELQRLIEEAQAEAEAIKDGIKAQMGDCEELTAGEYKVTWKTVISSRLDSKAFKSAMPDVYSRYCKETVTRPFKIY